MSTSAVAPPTREATRVKPEVADLVALGTFVRPTVAADQRVLPLRPDFADLLPGGLRRGTVAEVSHGGLLFAMLSAAMREGAWGAFVGAPSLGLAAAAEQGVPLERLAVIDRPPAEQAASVVAALLDAVELVVVGAGVIVRAADARRLSARLRERGGVLFVMGPWPEAADLLLTVTSSSWSGLDRGYGHVQTWTLDVTASGRGAASRQRSGTIALSHAPAVPENEEQPEQNVARNDRVTTLVSLTRAG